MPERIQRRRTKGWRMPEDAIYVGRPTKFGNPWLIVPDQNSHSLEAWVRHATEDRYAGRFERYSRGVGIGAPYWAMQHYRLHLQEHPELVAAARAELRGHDLCCWCPLDQPCHADVLLELCREA